jgi:hypothetical protein
MAYFDMPLTRRMLLGYRASSQKRPHALGPARQQQPPPHLDAPSQAKSAQSARFSPPQGSQSVTATQWAQLGRVGDTPTFQYQ